MSSFIRNVAHIAILVLLITCSACMYGADYTWSGGAGNGVWDDGSNWGGTAFPSLGDTARITVGSATTITLTSDVTIGALYIWGPNTVTIDLAGHTLTASGIFVLGQTGTSTDTTYGNVAFENGTVTVAIIDIANRAAQDSTLTLSNTTFTVTNNYYFDVAANSTHSLIIKGDENSIFDYSNASDGGFTPKEGAVKVDDTSPMRVDNIWKGSTSSDWTDKDNWAFGTLMGVPGKSATIQSVYIPSGTPNSPVLATALAHDLKNLEIKPGATLSIDSSGKVTVAYKLINAGTLDNAGDITSSAELTNTGTIKNSGNITSSSEVTNTGTIETSNNLTGITCTNSGTLKGTDGYVVFVTLTNTDTGTIISTGAVTYSGTTFTNNGTLKLGGGESLIGYTTKVSGTDSTIIYTGVTATAITSNGAMAWDADYYNLTISKGDAGGVVFTEGAAVTVNGTLTVETGASYSTSGYALAIGQALINNGTVMTTSIESIGGASCAITNNGSIVCNGVTEWTAATTTSSPTSSMTYACDGAASSPWTSYGKLTVNGSFTFDTVCTMTSLTASTTPSGAAGLGGEKLTVNKAITVTGAMTLTGTNTSSQLTVEGTGSITLDTAGQTSGRFLLVNKNGPAISQDYTCFYSKFSDGTYEKYDAMMHWKFIPNGWPQFIMCMAPVGQNKLLVLVSHPINTGTVTLYSDATTVATTENALSVIPQSFAITDTSGALDSRSTPLSIATTVPAKVAFTNDTTTGLILTLNRDVTFADIIANLYVTTQVADSSYYNGMSGTTGGVTYIQDTMGVSMEVGDMHILSDFAINVINPSYAYDNSLVDDAGNDMSYNLYSEGSWAVHDWSAEQQNFGTLSTGYDISLVANLDQDFASSTYKTYLYLDDTPDSGAICTAYGALVGRTCRAWLPQAYRNATGTIALTSDNKHCKICGKKTKDIKSLSESTIMFNLKSDDERYSSWTAGDQISFMFDIRDASGDQVRIDRFHDGGSTPLYALRLSDASDITSLDVWSFRLKGKTKQRGGVSIYNNVIDVNQGEKVIIDVDQTSRGPLSVIVMTLDGNVITYLHHGTANIGTYHFSWNGRNKAGNKVARGLYFIRVVGPNIDETRKVMCVKN